MTVVTISGQAGSGAREVGRLAAQRLEVDYIDQEILVRAARELGVPMESVVSRDERTAGLGERLASMFRRFLERSATAGSTDPMLGSGLDVVLSRTYGEAALEGTEDISDDDYLAALSSIVRDLAGQDDVLIIGRGSQVILKDRPGAFHALVVAPLDRRIEFYVQRDGLTEEEAGKREREGGRGRAAFHRKFFNVDVDDPSLYHLTVNTGLYSIEEAAQVVANATQAAGKAQASGAP